MRSEKIDHKDIMICRLLLLLSEARMIPEEDFENWLVSKKTMSHSEFHSYWDYVAGKKTVMSAGK